MSTRTFPDTDRFVSEIVREYAKPSGDLAASRAATAERARQDRLREAGEALRRAGLGREAADILDASVPAEDALTMARHQVSMLIVDLADGRDEPRYAAAMTARDALGRLWEVL